MALQLPVVQTGLEASIQAAMRNAGKGAVINLGTSGKQIASLSQPLGRITGQADQFTKSMEAANARVFAFGASVGIINNVAKAFKGIITSTIEVETSLANIYSVLDKAGLSAKEFESGLFEAAKNAGQSFKVAADAALELSRQGLNSQDVLKRLNDTLILTRLSGLDSAAAVEGLSAAYNSFAGTGITTTEILNKLVAVSQKYAVSEKDLIEGIKRAGSTAQQAGVSFDELAALITAVQEKTARGGAVIGNSFKTIFARLQDKTTLEYLSDLGIGVTDLEGKVLPATAIMEGLAAKFNDFSKIGQADIAEKLGGIYQLGNLLAALQDLSSEQSKYTGAIKVSAEAADQAYQKNAALNNTLESILNRVSVSAEQLGATLGSLGVTDNLKNILNFFTWLLDGIQKVLQEDSGIGKFFKGLVAGIGNLISGPGLALFGAIILKLSRDLVQFGFSSLKSFFGIGQAAKQIADVEKSVAQALSTNVSLQQRLLAVEGDRAAQLRIISAEIIAQEAMLRRIASTSAAIAPGLYGGGVRSTGQGLRVPKAADGYMPAVAEEASSVKRGVGGAKPSDKPVVIPNFNFGGGKRGTMVANSGEHIVPNFNGSGGSAIFNRDMVRKMGMPVGAQKINSAGGFVPNFANEIIESKTFEVQQLPKFKNMGKADLNDDFQTSIEIIRQKKSIGHYNAAAQSMAQSMAQSILPVYGKSTGKKINQEYFDKVIKGFEDDGVDKNAITKLKTSIINADPNKSDVDKNSNWTNIRSAIQGILGEVDAAKLLNTTITQGNAFVDLTSGEEVKTRVIQSSKDLMKKVANIYLETHNTKNGLKDEIRKNKLGGNFKVVMPLGSKLRAANGFIPNFAISQREAAYNAWDSPLKNGKPYDFVKNASGQKGTSPNKTEAIKISQALDLYIAENSAQNRNDYKSNKQESVTKRRADTSGAVAEFGMIYPSNSKGSVSSFLVGSQNEVVKGIPIIGKPSDDLYPEIEKGIINAGMNYAKNLGFNPDIIQEERFAAGIKSHLNPGTIEAAFGTVFESVFQSAMQVPPNNNQTLDLPNRSKLNSFVGSMERGGILKASIANNINPEMLAADFKNDLSDLNLSSMAAKIKAYRDKQATRGNTTKTSARGFIPNFANSSMPPVSMVPMPKSAEYQRRQRERSAKAQKYRSASGLIGDLFKTLPEKFFTDLVLGDSDYGVETPSIFKAIKDSALYSAAFAGPNALKFVQEAEEYGLKVAKSLQDKLAKLVVKATTKKSSANGFLPNFADPIKDAVGREMSAGVPASQIYIDQNSSLKSAMNPNGLMVANRIDEPMGGSQGIARARKEGSNPMTYGAARGFVPNYANIGSFQTQGNSITSNQASINQPAVNTAAAAAAASSVVISAASQAAAKLSLPKSTARSITQYPKVNADTFSDKNSQVSGEKMLGTIFAIQGALSVLQGVVGEVSGEMGVALRVITSGLSSLTTGAFALQGLQGMGGLIGGATKALGPYALALGAATAATNAFVDYMNETSGANTVAAKSVERVDRAASQSSGKLEDYAKTAQDDIRKRASIQVEAMMGENKTDGGYKIFGDTPQLKAVKEIYAKGLGAGAFGPDLADILKKSAENGLTDSEVDDFSISVATFIEAINKVPDEIFNSIDKSSEIYKALSENPTTIENNLKNSNGLLYEPLYELRKKFQDAGMRNDDAINKNIMNFASKVKTETNAKDSENQMAISRVPAEVYKQELNSIIKIAKAKAEAKRVEEDLDTQALQKGKELGALSESQINILQYKIALKSEDLKLEDLHRDALSAIVDTMDAQQISDEKRITLKTLINQLADKDRITAEDIKNITEESLKAQGTIPEIVAKTAEEKKKALELDTKVSKIAKAILEAENGRTVATLKTKQAINEIIQSTSHLLTMKNFQIDLTATIKTNEIEKEIRRLELNQPQNTVAARAQAAQIAQKKYELLQTQSPLEAQKKFNNAKTGLINQANSLSLNDTDFANLQKSIESSKNISELQNKAKIPTGVVFNRDKYPEYASAIDTTIAELKQFDANTAGSIAAASDELAKSKLPLVVKKFSDYVIDLNDGLDAAIEQAKFEFLSTTSGSGLLDKASKDKFNAEMKSAGTSSSGISQAYANEAARSDQRRLALAGSAGDKTSIEYDIEINKKILAIKQESVDTQTLSEDQEARILELEKQRLEVNKSLSQKLKEAFATSPQDQINKLNNTLVEGAVKFRDTMIDGIVQAIETGKGLKDVLTSAVLDFSRELMRTSLRNLTGSLFGGIGGMFGQGNQISTGASGGAVSGGSGSKDDVPAMLMGGEYIINKKSVNKYGPKFLEAINSGNLNGYAKGGKVKDYFTPGTYGVKQMTTDDDLLAFATQESTSGKKDKIRSGDGFASVSLEPESVRLTNFGRRNSPQAQRAKDVRKQIFGIYIDEMKKAAELKRQEEEEKKARKKAIKNALIMAGISIAGSALIGAATSGFSNAYSTSKLAGGTFGKNVGSGVGGMFTGGGVSGLQGNNYGGLFNMFSKSGYVTKASQMAGSITSKGFIGPVQNSSNVNIGNNIAQPSFPLGGSSETYAGGLFPMGLTPELGASGPGMSYGTAIDLTNPNSEDPYNPFRITTRAVGGSISETAGIDTIPTMLSGGEFVMNRAAAQNIGPGNLQAMNAGASKPMSEEASKDLNNKLISKFDELIGTTEKSTGSITINVDGSSGKSSENSSGQTQGANQQLSRQIRDAVLKVIQEEKRLGGQLRRGM